MSNRNQDWQHSPQRGELLTKTARKRQDLRGMPKLYKPLAVLEAEKWVLHYTEATENAKERVRQLEDRLIEAEKADVDNAFLSIREGAAEQELTAPGIRELLEEARVKLQAHEKVLAEIWDPVIKAVREEYVTWRRGLMAALPEAEVEAQEAFEDFLAVWKDAKEIRDGILFLDRFMVNDPAFAEQFDAVLPSYFERTLRAVLDSKHEDSHRERPRFGGVLGQFSANDVTLRMEYEVKPKPSYLDEWDPEQGLIDKAAEPVPDSLTDDDE